MDKSLAKINAASDQVRDTMAHSAQHALRTAKLFLGTVIACTCIVAGTLWWSHHIVDGLAEDQADLAALEFKLKHKPVFMHFKDHDFVRVIPGSETGFTRGDDSELPGRYAQVWHVR